MSAAPGRDRRDEQRSRWDSPSGDRVDPAAPVAFIPGDDSDPAPRGMGLCLSGGGYRAMLFHAGVVRRLYETGVLARLERVSSVSGGSLTAGVLALAWKELDPSHPDVERFVRLVQDPLRRMASTCVDVPAGVTGLLSPWSTISEHVIGAYSRVLFGDAGLAELPVSPRFVINATNLASGALFRFTRDYVADWRVGWIPDPPVSVATAVAASSAFPPFLSPLELDLRDAHWQPPTRVHPDDALDDRFRGAVRLCDGGVYDNLGLETVWKRCATVLVSDAGKRSTPHPAPPADWARGTLTVLDTIDHQVRALRKRQLIGSFTAPPGPGHRDGFYVGTYSHLDRYDDRDPALPADPAITKQLAEIPTRLTATPTHQQQQLINWGYVIADAGLRTHLQNPDDSAATYPTGTLPYPDAALGAAATVST